MENFTYFVKSDEMVNNNSQWSHRVDKLKSKIINQKTRFQKLGYLIIVWMAIIAPICSILLPNYSLVSCLVFLLRGIVNAARCDGKGTLAFGQARRVVNLRFY